MAVFVEQVAVSHILSGVLTLSIGIAQCRPEGAITVQCESEDPTHPLSPDFSDPSMAGCYAKILSSILPNTVTHVTLTGTTLPEVRASHRHLTLHITSEPPSSPPFIQYYPNVLSTPLPSHAKYIIATSPTAGPLEDLPVRSPVVYPTLYPDGYPHPVVCRGSGKLVAVHYSNAYVGVGESVG
eukprot:TRINITY_DN15414_c0_g1_i1.p1 TRINITY_DN15414_c0_g1~~TRINITY_DN15414_c0_g1_i1.p1  ORF type:complete len:204 (+),score=14.23 TRINITY_DN15414_c0_g1_i1:65-613(+)